MERYWGSVFHMHITPRRGKLPWGGLQSYIIPVNKLREDVREFLKYDIKYDLNKKCISSLLFSSPYFKYVNSCLFKSCIDVWNYTVCVTFCSVHVCVCVWGCIVFPKETVAVVVAGLLSRDSTLLLFQRIDHLRLTHSEVGVQRFLTKRLLHLCLPLTYPLPYLHYLHFHPTSWITLVAFKLDRFLGNIKQLYSGTSLCMEVVRVHP